MKTLVDQLSLGNTVKINLKNLQSDNSFFFPGNRFFFFFFWSYLCKNKKNLGFGVYVLYYT